MAITRRDMADPPEWARWCAMDKDGHWWCYEAEPHLHDTGWYENEVGRSARIANGPHLATDWQRSLCKIARD